MPFNGSLITNNCDVPECWIDTQRKRYTWKNFLVALRSYEVDMKLILNLILVVYKHTHFCETKLKQLIVNEVSLVVRKNSYSIQYNYNYNCYRDNHGS